MLNGTLTTMYHYVMTQDFPYSVSCFHGKSYEPQPGASGMQGMSAEALVGRPDELRPLDAFGSHAGHQVVGAAGGRVVEALKDDRFTKLGSDAETGALYAVEFGAAQGCDWSRFRAAEACGAV